MNSREKHDALWTNGSFCVLPAVRYRSSWRLIWWSLLSVNETYSFRYTMCVPVCSVHVHGMCVCVCASVEPAEVKLVGELAAIEGQDLILSCYAASSNPPVQIRWWLGYKELNASAVTVEEVRQCRNLSTVSEQKAKRNKGRRTQWVIIGVHAGR